MSKKAIWAIAIVVVIAVITICVYLFGFAGKGGNAKVNITTVGESIANKEPYSEMAMMDIDKQILTSLYQIDEAMVEEVNGKMPMMNVHATMYVLIKAKDGKVDEVKAKVEEYGKSYEEQWSTYLPDQHELVKNRKVGVKGNVVYMIVSENASEIEKLIK